MILSILTGFMFGEHRGEGRVQRIGFPRLVGKRKMSLFSSSNMHAALPAVSRFVLALLMVCAGQAWGSEKAFLGLVSQAVAAHPGVRVAERELAASETDKAGARWQRYPTPSFVSQTPSQNNSSGTSMTVNRAVIEQPLYAGGGIDASIDAADARYKSGLARFHQVEQETAIRLFNTWYEWQRHKARQSVLQESVDAHRKLRNQIQRRFAEGVSPEADLALAEARLSQTQSELSQAQSAARAAYAQLSQLAGAELPRFGDKALGDWAGDTRSYLLPPSDWRPRSITLAPQLAKLAADEEAAEAEIRVKRATLIPTVKLRYENDFSAEQYAGSRQRVFLALNAQPGAGLSALSGIESARARRDSVVESRRNALLELEQALEIDLADHLSARERMEVAKLLIRSTEEVTESYSRQFVAGRKSWLDVLNSVREAVSARLSVADAQALLGQTWWRLRIRALGLSNQPEA